MSADEVSEASVRLAAPDTVALARGPGRLVCLIGLALVFVSLTRTSTDPSRMHPADLLLAVLALIWAADVLRRRTRPPAPVVPAIALATAALAGIALASSHEPKAGLIEVLKIAEYMAVGTLVFANIALFRAKRLAGTLAISTVVLVAVAAGQYVAGSEPREIAGLLDNRTLYGGCVAAGAPFVVAYLFAWGSPIAVGLAFAFIVLAGGTILSAPMLVAFGGSCLLAASLMGRRFATATAVALACLAGWIGAGGPSRDNAAVLADSVTTFTDDGRPRRSLIERMAAGKAVADRPLLGHGPGNYQRVVGLGRYRGSLPPPAEDRVEPGTQRGYLVAAVEFGVPAALLIGILLLGVGARALSMTGRVRASDEQWIVAAAAASAFALAGGMAFTNFLVRGPGLFFAAILGLCEGMFAIAERRPCAALLAARATEASPWPPLLWRGAAVGVPVLLGALACATGFRAAPQEDEYGELPAADLCGAGRTIVVLEAEACDSSVSPMRPKPDRNASGQACVGIEEGAGKPPQVEGVARYAVPIRHHGRYRVWVRAWWTDGCANSVAVSLEGGPAYLVGNDGTYSVWHWVRGPVEELREGPRQLTLLHREDGIEIDQILLANDDAFVPEGIQMPTVEPPRVSALKPPEPDPPEPRPPVSDPIVPKPPDPRPIPPADPAVKPPIPDPDPAVAETVAKPRKKFLVGIGGSYRDGFEGHLIAMGVPYVRLHQAELADIEALGDVDVLMLSDPRPSQGTIYPMLYAFLKSGRTAIVEYLPEKFPARGDTENLMLQREFEGRKPFGNAVLLPDDSHYFRGVPNPRPYNPDVASQWLPLSTDAPGARVYGAVGNAWERPPQKAGGALLVRSYGGGKLYFLALCPAYAAMWRERKIDPYFLNVMREAVGGRCEYPFEKFEYAPKPVSKVDVADDFMRAPGQKGAWTRLEGAFMPTGEMKQEVALGRWPYRTHRFDEMAFSIHAVGDSFAVTGEATWRDYRPAISLILKNGAAGLWTETAGGGRLLFVLKDAGKKAALLLRTAEGDKVLAEAPVPDYPNGWRRLSIVRRDGVLAGFVDGFAAVEIKETPETPRPEGRCGMCTIAGDAYFDDFRAVDAASLAPGRDVAAGEEGSDRCMIRYRQRCFERLSVYSPQWMLRPDPLDGNLFHVALPLFCGGALHVDDRPPVPIPPGQDFPAVRFPGGNWPEFDLSIRTPGWRDYHFAGRVTDWYASSGSWAQTNRWSCSPDYQWLGGGSRDGDSVLWYKRDVSGSVAVEAMMAPRADEQYGEEVGRDLNLVVFGNGRDLKDGYHFVVSDEDHGCRVERNGQIYGAARGIGLPRGHALHHPWFSVAVVITGKKIRLYFDRRLAIECTDDEPVSQGKIGIWTRRNKVSVARVTLSLSPQAPRKRE